MDSLGNVDSVQTSKDSSIDIAAWKQKCYEAMNDDFNTPILIANLFEAVKYINLIKEGKETISAKDLAELIDTMNSFVFDILGLERTSDAGLDSDKLSGVVSLLIQMREEARANIVFACCDCFWVGFAALGIQLKDGKEGTTFSIS